MTATLVALLAKDGVLSWNTTLAQALPELSAGMDNAHRNTTLKMLTAHRSGLVGDYVQDAPFYESLYDPLLTEREGRWLITERAMSKPPAGQLGTFAYDNINFVIAGAIIDVITNSTWEAVIRSRLFAPLDMGNCGFGPNDESSRFSIENPWPHQRNPVAGAPALPMTKLDLRHRDSPPAINSAGRVHCPMEQYNKFLRVHVDGACGKETPLGLSPEDFRFLHMPYLKAEGEEPYTPGAWRSPNRSPDGSRYTLTHVGSNKYNYVTAWAVIGGGRAETYMSMTNVGGYKVGEGTQRVVKELMNQSLLF